MDKAVRSIRPIKKIELGERRISFEEEKIDFILNGGRVLKDTVIKDEQVISIFGKESRTHRIKGESVLATINRLNLREHEIEYIILNKVSTNSIEDQSLTTKISKLIYSKYETD